MNRLKNLSKSLALLGIILLIVISGASFLTKVSAAASWYNYGWQYRKKITVDHTKVPNTDQLNFPVLISLTDSDLQAHARSDGYDILFTDSTGTTKIPHEREQYAASSGALIAWVRVTSLSHSTDTVVYMYYGNSGASDQQDLAGGTWDANFQGVWHSNDASPTTIADSTANANTGTKYGATGPVETTGKIGKAQSYNGSDSYIGITPSGTLASSFTVSTWAKVSDSEISRIVIGTRNDGDYTFDFKFENGEIIHGDIGDGTEWITNEADVSLSYSHDTWYQVTYVITPTGYTIYIDGNNAASGSYPESTPLLFDPSHNIFIGQVGYDDEWFSGVIDEIRISDTARSADWIQTEYNNENSSSEFYSVESEEIGDGTPPTTPGIPHAVIGSNLTSQTWSWTASTDAGSGLSYYHWQVDGGPSGTTVATTITTNLAVGNWKFHVKAEDNAGNQSAAQSALLAILSSSLSQITIDNSVPIAWIITPTGISNPAINVSPITSLNGNLWVANLNTELHLKTLLPSITVTVDIPAGAAIEGPSSTWTKVIIPPIAITPPVSLLPPTPLGFSNQVTLAIEVGHEVAPLEITRGTRIFLEGQAKKKVGYISQGIFTEITNICPDDSQTAGDNLTPGQDCKIKNGSDLIIWSKHFSKFITYDLVLSVTSTPSITTGTSSNPVTATNTPSTTPGTNNNPTTPINIPSTTPSASNNLATNTKTQSKKTKTILVAVLTTLIAFIIFTVLLRKLKDKKK